MKAVKYKVEKGENLKSISEKFKVDVENLKSFHNSRSGMSNLIVSDELPLHLDSIFINQNIFEKEIIENKNFEKTMLKNLARYRCEQLNISRINNEIITLSANTYSEFLVSYLDHTRILGFDMTDFTFSVDPVVYEKGVLFAQKLEKLKLPITFNVTEEGLSGEILNFDEIGKRWIKFRDFDLKNEEIYQQLLSQAPKQAEDIIATGDKEFLEKNNFSKMLDKNLFFHVFLRAYAGESLQNYEITQFSQLFPNINLKTDVVKSKVSEDSEFVTYRLVGTLDKKNLSEEQLKNMYDTIYKSTIKYNYTEFDFIYRITYTIEKKTNLLQQGKASIAEKIKNNFEVITEYNIKKVEV
ncbi:LysM peptidoglycan-binding domain-containing protein [Chryseobacterium sp. RLHN22]|uniref:LysM peptidoglycan-binding domain-containing protein n=1 Tax=Chryseobacterium sp. RLHN22 TaxID=3437885 RepID=UPI003D9BC059